MARSGVLAHVNATNAEAAALAVYEKDLAKIFSELDASLLPRPPELAANAPETLRKNRKIFDDHLAALEEELSSALRSSLETLEGELTRDSKIAEARTVRDYRENRVGIVRSN